MRGTVLTSQLITIFVVILLGGFLSYMLLSNAPTGFLSRTSIETGTISPAPVKVPAPVITFHSNLPDNGDVTSSLDSGREPFKVYIQGMTSNMQVTSARVSVDGQVLSTNFTNMGSENMRGIEFPDVTNPPIIEIEGSHLVTYRITLSTGVTYQVNQTYGVDETPPVITFTSALGQNPVQFHVSDTTGVHWSSANDYLRVMVIDTANNDDIVVLGTGAPTCVPITPGTLTELNCSYTFPNPVPNSQNVLVLAQDRSRNVSYATQQGSWATYGPRVLERVHQKGLQANTMGTVNASPYSAEQTLSLQGGPDVTFTPYIFHLSNNTPTPDEITSGWTLLAKITNTHNAVDEAAQYWQNYLRTTFPNNTVSFVRGPTTLFLSANAPPVPPEVAALVQRVIVVPNSGSTYPTMTFPPQVDHARNCNNDYEVCVEYRRIGDVTGSQDGRFEYVAMKRGTDEDWFIENPQKTPSVVPIIVNDGVEGAAAYVDSYEGIMHAAYLGFAGGPGPPGPFNYSLYRSVIKHEMGHIFGLGENGFMNNIMYGQQGGVGDQLSIEQRFRVQAGLRTAEFKPAIVGQWFDGWPPNGWMNDCGPDPYSDHTLEEFAGHREQCETTFSGLPRNPEDLIDKGLDEEYCALKVDGQGQILPTPVAVSSRNFISVQSQYPGATFHKCQPESCVCNPIPPQNQGDRFPGGTSGPSNPVGGESVPTGTGGGGNGEEEEEDEDGGGDEPTCGSQPPTLSGNSDGTFTASGCSSYTCPVATGEGENICAAIQTSAENVPTNASSITVYSGEFSATFYCACGGAQETPGEPAEETTPSQSGSQ